MTFWLVVASVRDLTYSPLSKVPVTLLTLYNHDICLYYACLASYLKQKIQTEKLYLFCCCADIFIDEAFIFVYHKKLFLFYGFLSVLYGLY